MARGLNHVYLVGALARDPELSYTPNGMQCAASPWPVKMW